MPNSRSPWLLLATVLFGTLLVGIDRTVTNLAIPKIISEFSISASTAGWVATAYIITSAVFIPIFGKLGDIYGDRKVFIGGMTGFMLTSLITALAWNIPVLVLFRALQGVCGAAILPTAMAAITKGFTESSARAQALGIWTAANAGAATVAPLLGGPLIDHFGWRSVFFINLPLGVIAVLFAQLHLKNDRLQIDHHFDILGATILGAALTTLVLVIDRGSSWGWFSFAALLCYALTIAFGLLFLYQQEKVKNPIIDRRLFRNITATSGLLTTFFAAMSLYSLTLILSLFTQQTLHYTATQTGYFYLPLALPLLVISPFGARVSRYLPPRITIAAGMVGSAGAIFLLSHSTISNGLGAVALPLALFGIFWGFTSAPLSTAIANSAPRSQAGMISGLRNLALSVGGAIGISLYSGIYSYDQTQGISYPVAFHFLYGLSAAIMIFSACFALLIRESSKDF